MHSPAERLRQRWRREGLLRGVAFAAVLAGLLIAWWPSRADDGELSLRQRFAGAPAAQTRDSLAALARAGRHVTWEGDAAPLIAMAEPLREPGDRWRVSAISQRALAARDSLGLVDSLSPGGAALSTEATRGPLQLVDGQSVATAMPPVTAEPSRVLVLGRPGWESRFVAAALEEAGWQVDLRIPLGRGRDVTQGVTSPRVDRHGVVIVLDSASARREASVLLRFLRAGGGVILAADAADAPVAALRAVSAARVTAVEPPETRSFEGHEPTHALPLHALRLARDDGIVLEDREGTPAVVVRRVSSGRLLQLGYADTWRWRMEGEGRAPAEHRAYWSWLVGLVSPSRSLPREAVAATDPAPTAALVQALGPASPEPSSGSSPGPQLPLWLGPLILVALLAEWASRRTRGAP